MTNNDVSFYHTKFRHLPFAISSCTDAADTVFLSFLSAVHTLNTVGVVDLRIHSANHYHIVIDKTTTVYGRMQTLAIGALDLPRKRHYYY